LRYFEEWLLSGWNCLTGRTVQVFGVWIGGGHVGLLGAGEGQHLRLEVVSRKSGGPGDEEGVELCLKHLPRWRTKRQRELTALKGTESDAMPWSRVLFSRLPPVTDE
jgi:hypothetical protein